MSNDLTNIPFVTRHELTVDPDLAAFVETEALPGTGVDADVFWRGFSDLAHALSAKNTSLLKKRSELQALISAWHKERRGRPHDPIAYKDFLVDIGYPITGSWQWERRLVVRKRIC